MDYVGLVVTMGWFWRFLFNVLRTFEIREMGEGVTQGD